MDTLTNSVCVLTEESEMALSLYTFIDPTGRFRDVIGVPRWSCFHMFIEVPVLCLIASALLMTKGEKIYILLIVKLIRCFLDISTVLIKYLVNLT